MTTAKNYLSLGESFEEKGKYFKAERLYKKALKAVEAELGDDNESLIPYLYNLGMVQAALDKTGQAVKNLGRALTLMLNTLDESDDEIVELRQVLEEINPTPSAKAVNS